tara:strand:- start:18863 stop:20158 length:1296 start_codon:yes stop_codon:yes gene_type:complete
MPVIPVIKVSSIHIYPIKSTAGISLPHAKVEELGLAFDRRFIVCDPCGQFITARTEPRLCLVQTNLLEHGIELSAPTMSTLTLSYVEFTNQYQKVTIWGDEVAGQLCANSANAWFSDYLQRPCTLLFFGENSSRERKPNTDSSRKLAFSDGYPLLLISQASLDNLNARLVDKRLGGAVQQQQQPVSMTQFRPNIVIDNCLPFAEDGWQHIRIGAVEFKVSKPCERCVFTTVNPLNGEKHPQQQPLRMLKTFRQTPNGEVLFGQNLIALNSGTINQGDRLTIISKQKPPTFILSDSTHEARETQIPSISTQDVNTPNDPIVDKSENKKLTVFFEKWNKNYQIPSLSQKANVQGNNQAKTLLENGEDAGLILPYSCRAGMCGRCKAKLISGEVRKLSMDSVDGLEGLTEQEKKEGYILCCSTIAMSNVVIKHT